ncbi:unnamed protein product [Hapterophycus canaliculatus]
MPLTAESSFQPPADASPSVSISTLDSPDSVPLAPAAHRAGSPLSQRVVLGLLAVVVALLGTNAYYFNQAHAWKVHRLDCWCYEGIHTSRYTIHDTRCRHSRVAKLEKDSATPKIDVDPLATPPSCPGSQLIDTCWFKVGWGDCTKEVIEDPIKPVEDAFRLAWDSTTEVVGFVVDTIASDFREVGKAIHELGSFLFEL